MAPRQERLLTSEDWRAGRPERGSCCQPGLVRSDGPTQGSEL